jgi:uncharacterized RDD family membrane protein YckC
MPSGQPDEPKLRRVLGISAAASAVNGGARNVPWDYPPGRLEVMSSLPGAPELVGMVGSPVGAVALMRDRRSPPSTALPAEKSKEEGAGGSWMMKALVRNSWVGVDLPWESAGSLGSAWDTDASAWLVSWDGARDGGPDVGVLLIGAKGKGEQIGELWTAQFSNTALTPSLSPGQEGETKAAAEIEPTWSRQELKIPARLASAAVRSESARVKFAGVVESGGGLAGPGGERRHLAAVMWDSGSGQRATVIGLREQGPVEVSVLEGVARDAWVTAVGRECGASGLALVWLVEGAGAGVEGMNGGADPIGGARTLGAPVLMMREITMSGVTLFDGRVKSGPTRFRDDVELLAVILVMVMTGVVLYVVKSDGPVKLRLPEGMELADPMRRIAGAVLDYAPSALVAALVMGVPVSRALLPVPFVSESVDMAPVGLALGIAWLHTSVCEWLFGRSLGKFMTGTRLMSVPRVSKAAGGAASEEQVVVGERLGLGGCLVRNLVRWSVPFLGLLLFVDATRRHLGDMAGRTVVVQSREPDRAADEQDEGGE